MSGTIDLALIPAFVEVVRRGTFTAASASLGLPKSTLSRRVSRLEKELGVQLLVRTTRQLRLTDVGRVFYDRVAPTLEAVEDAAREVSEVDGEARGHLRVAAPQDMGELLAEFILEFTRSHPEVEVELRLSGEVVDLVAEGFDVALRAGRLPDSTLVARRLATGVMRLQASAAYLEEAGTPKTLADLASHACVLFRAREGVQKWRLDGPNGPEEVDVRGAISADDYRAVAGVVRAGGGIGLLPSIAGSEGLACVLPEYSLAGGGLYLVYPGARHVPAKVRAFRDFCVAEFKARLPAPKAC
ncbi:MAG: LysR family transcriptional regulator [Sandaracinaceae bacterium]